MMEMAIIQQAVVGVVLVGCVLSESGSGSSFVWPWVSVVWVSGRPQYTSNRCCVVNHVPRQGSLQQYTTSVPLYEGQHT